MPSLVLHTMCLTLFKLIFLNHVKHEKLSTGQPSLGGPKGVFWTTVATNTRPDVNPSQLFGSSLVLHTTCLTWFKLIFLNHVKHEKPSTGQPSLGCHKGVFWTMDATNTRPDVNSSQFLAVPILNTTCLTLLN